MIVKNEAATLERCLESARPYVEEIVIVDTGSTDGTQEIARRYADVFDEIEWPDSFAIARNHSLDLASGDFVLILDGDEYIPDSVHWRRMRKALRQPNLAGAQLLVRNLSTEESIVGAERMWQERIFRNHPSIRYIGRVHNQIQESLQAYMERTGHRYIRIQAEVIHTGYSMTKERMREKYKPRLHLLEAEYYKPRSAKYRAYYGYQLGVIYYIMGEWEKTVRVLNELDYSLLTRQNEFYSRLIAAQAALKLHNAPLALVHCNEMLSIDRNEPVAYYTTGLALLLHKQISDGLLMLLEAFKIHEQYESSVRFLLNPQQLFRSLARVCRRVGLHRPAEAFQAFYEQREPDMEKARALIKKLQTGIALRDAEAA